jgi:hypothetical protein
VSPAGRAIGLVVISLIVAGLHMEASNGEEKWDSRTVRGAY